MGGNKQGGVYVGIRGIIGMNEGWRDINEINGVISRKLCMMGGQEGGW